MRTHYSSITATPQSATPSQSLQKTTLSFSLILPAVLSCCLLLAQYTTFAANKVITASTSWSAIPGGVPGASDKVIVRNGATLTIDTDAAACKQLEIGQKNEGAGTVVFNPGSVLTVSGTLFLGDGPGNGSASGILNMQNGGELSCQALDVRYETGSSFMPGTGMIELTNQKNLPSGIFVHFNNLILSGVTKLSADLEISGDLEIRNGGSLECRNNALLLGGNFFNSGDFDAGSETVTFNGSSNYQISGDFTGSNEFNELVFNGNGASWTLNGNISVNANLTITQGSVIVASGKNLTVDELTTLGTPGCLTLKSDASNGTATFIDHGINGTGTAIVERYIANDFRWHFLSSPVSDQAIWPSFAPDPGAALNFGTSWNWDFYYWNPNASITSGLYWINLRKNAAGDYNDNPVDAPGNLAGYGTVTPPQFTVGRGYLVAYNTGWNTASGSPEIHNFTGTPNSGNISFPIKLGESGYNLAGNPYPSTIDWKSSNWGTGRNSVVSRSGGFDYWVWNDADGNYGVFNSRGSNGSGTHGVTRYIAPGQAFFIKANADGNLVFNNTIRVSNAKQWLKDGEVDFPVIRLALTTEANSYNDEMVVEFNTGINDGSEKFWSLYNEAPEIYSIVDGNAYSLTRLSELSGNTTLLIGTRTGIEGSYTLTAPGIESFTLSGQVILEDLKTGVLTDLKVTPSYTFQANPGDDPARFRLLIQSATGIEAPAQSTLSAYASGRSIYIRNTTPGRVLNATISDISGKTVYTGTLQDTTVQKIDLNTTPGIYIVNLITSTEAFTAKVILN